MKTRSSGPYLTARQWRAVHTAIRSELEKLQTYDTELLADRIQELAEIDEAFDNCGIPPLTLEDHGGLT